MMFRILKNGEAKIYKKTRREAITGKNTHRKKKERTI